MFREQKYSTVKHVCFASLRLYLLVVLFLFLLPVWLGACVTLCRGEGQLRNGTVVASHVR